MLRLALLKVALALVPSAAMAAMQTTTIRASMTAYSTAVGPSSSRKNWHTLLNNLDIQDPLLFRAGPNPWARRGRPASSEPQRLSGGSSSLAERPGVFP